jgi:hypothetical protein
MKIVNKNWEDMQIYDLESCLWSRHAYFTLIEIVVGKLLSRDNTTDSNERTFLSAMNSFFHSFLNERVPKHSESDQTLAKK